MLNVITAHAFSAAAPRRLARIGVKSAAMASPFIAIRFLLVCRKHQGSVTNPRWMAALVASVLSCTFSFARILLT
jgi:hypothetical protein